MSARRMVSRTLRARSVPWLVLALGLWAPACGGGGGGGSSEPTSAVTTSRITGSVYAGPVTGASLVVQDGSGATVAGPVTTSAAGAYVVEVPTAALVGNLTFEASGGTFTDEATGATTAGGRLAALAPAGSLATGASVHLTPASTILEDLVVRHGRTRAQANTALGAAFGFTPDLAVQPANAPTATPASRLAGLRAAAFSQLTQNLGLAASVQFDLLAALAEDLADGALDGVGSSTVPLPEDVQNRFAQALAAFLGCPEDHTGLDVGEIGFLPFAKVALTETYRVEYEPVPPGAALGATPLRLRVTERASGAAAAGLGVALAPAMHMASSQDHGTPVGGVTDNGDGSYTGSVYYTMAGGAPYGYWSLSVDLNDGAGVETATFYPAVGDPNSATLRGQGDRVWDAGVQAPLRRAYYLFDAGLVEEDPTRGTYGFSVFVAAREDDWVFPPLAVGTELHDENEATWSVSTVLLEVSADAGRTWIPATPAGPGLWSVAGLAIDSNAEELTFSVRLSVNGERKTTDGQPLSGDGANGFAELTSGGASCCL